MCGAVEVVATGEQATVRCTRCDWHYTYNALPKRFETAVRELLVWLKSRERRENCEERDG